MIKLVTMLTEVTYTLETTFHSGTSAVLVLGMAVDDDLFLTLTDITPSKTSIYPKLWCFVAV